MSGISLCAANDNDTKKEKKGSVPNFDTWTEKQIKQWEDSVRNALYPRPEIEKSKSSGKTTGGNTSPNKMSSGSLINTYVNDSYTIDKSKSVGEIPISSSVAPSGAITYNVPVEIYPGIKNFQPQLSIAYNSHAGDGILGIGWNLAGLSSISKTEMNIYYDGKSQGIGITKNNAFTLDGVRLIKIDENSSQIKYETEQGYIKVNANVVGNIVRYFEVYYPNGLKGVFGNPNDTWDYLSYPITSLSDMNGNTVSYNYSYSNNRYLINSITYNGASIEFVYTTRTYPIVFYSGGTKITENQNLQKIICKFESTVLRTYEFAYQEQNYNFLLSQIKCATPSNSLNPLRFFYGEGYIASGFTKTDTQLYEWYNFTQPGQVRVVKGKFDYGNEDDGLISLPNNISYWQYYRKTLGLIQNRYENYYSGTEKIFFLCGT